MIDVLATQILRAADCAAFAILTYCFMPDHVHLLAEGTSRKARLPKFLKLAKQLSGFHGKRVIGSAVWQAGYFDRLLRLNEDPRRVAAYILLNPVRAHLVSRPEDYPFSGSGVFTRAELFAYARLTTSRQSSP